MTSWAQLFIRRWLMAMYLITSICIYVSILTCNKAIGTVVVQAAQMKAPAQRWHLNVANILVHLYVRHLNVVSIF